MLDERSERKRAWSRRRFLALGAGAFAITALPVTLRSFSRGSARLIRRTCPVMGTLAEVAVVEADRQRAQRAIDAAFERLLFVDRSMTRFDPESEIGRANAAAARRPVRVGSHSATVLREALRWARGTGGTFDPALGKVTEIWDVVHRRTPPEGSELAELRDRRFHRALEIEGERVHFADPEVAIDLGGIAKGYAVDLAIEALREQGVQRALVNVGGDLRAIGVSEDGDAWRIGVRSAADPGRIARDLTIHDQAVATSGDYLRFFDSGGRRYHHLLDPSTAAPRTTEQHSLTIVARTCMAADAAATAAFGRCAGGALPPAIRALEPSARLA